MLQKCYFNSELLSLVIFKIENRRVIFLFGDVDVLKFLNDLILGELFKVKSDGRFNDIEQKRVNVLVQLIRLVY